MILSLPLFPSQDGPVHLYYVDVLRGLLSHTGPYPQYFEIKSYLTPYMLEYYSLLCLEKVFSPLLSEKLLICVYVLTFVFGFRYLLDSVTEDPGPWALAGTLFCLNLYIYMGFLNYALGTALVLFLAGFWLRYMKELTAQRIAIQAAGFVLLALTHPVPTAVFLSFACLYLTVSLIDEGMRGPGRLKAALPKYLRPCAAIAVMGLVACLWVLHFTGTQPKATRMVGLPLSLPLRTLNLPLRICGELLFYRLEPFDVDLGACRLFLILLVAIAMIAVLIPLWRRRGSVGATSVSIIAFTVVYFILTCVVPSIMNGSAHFSERFSIYWVLFLIAAAAAMKPPRWCTVAAGILALEVAMTMLYFQWNYLSSTARDLNNAINVPLVKPGSLGAIMTEYVPAGEPAVNPYMWGSANFFRESQAILTNAPWMDLKIIMFRAKQINPWTYEDAPVFVPQEILDILNKHGDVQLDFLVRYGASGADTQEVTTRLGFQRIGKAPQLAFYYRPSDLQRAGVDNGQVSPP
jgi:hypothetical protein